jgi:hypothetical protein
VSDGLEAVLNRMLLASPSQRFQSAAEVLDALDAIATPQLPPQRVNPLPTPPPTQQPINPPPQPVPAPTPPTPPPTVVPPTPATPPLSRSRRAPFSLVEVLAGAAFTGFEGALILMVLGSLLENPALSMGLWGMLMGAMIYAEFRRIIEKFDFVIIAGISLLAVVFFQWLWDFPLPDLPFVLVVSVLAAAGAIAVTAIFRLIYKLISRLL